MFKTCCEQVEKAPPFPSFQQRKVINTHINISCPHFVDKYMHFLMPIYAPDVHQKNKQHFSNVFPTWVIHILLIYLCIKSVLIMFSKPTIHPSMWLFLRKSVMCYRKCLCLTEIQFAGTHINKFVNL